MSVVDYVVTNRSVGKIEQKMTIEERVESDHQPLEMSVKEEA